MTSVKTTATNTARYKKNNFGIQDPESGVAKIVIFVFLSLWENQMPNGGIREDTNAGLVESFSDIMRVIYVKRKGSINNLNG